jgi:hypothetical protein
MTAAICHQGYKQIVEGSYLRTEVNGLCGFDRNEKENILKQISL